MRSSADYRAGRLRLVCMAILFAYATCIHSAGAQSGAQTRLLDPKSFGFEIPPGKLYPPSEERILTTDEESRGVVAKTHLRIGDYRVVLLPDGQLVCRKPNQAEVTQRPFEPISPENLAEKLQASEFQGFKVKQSKHYVYLYTCSEEFAFGTHKILESMLPGVKRFIEGMKIAVHDPETPLVVVMFRSEADFQRYRRMPEGVVAYYDPLTNRVAVYEQSGRFGNRRDLEIQQAISTIAHEGTHQILHNIGVQQRLSLWPMWLSEGMAEYLAPTSVDKRLQWKGAAQVNDMRMFELEQYLKSKAAEERKGDTVQHTVLAGRLTSTGYASAWSLTHYLATKKKLDFNKYLAEMAKIGPLQGAVEIEPPGIVKQNATTFEKHFGSDYVYLEKNLVMHLTKLPYKDPFAGEPHYVAMVSYSDGKRNRREANTFHSSELAANWVTEAAAKDPSINVRDAIIREFPNRLQAEAFARVWVKGK